jgi:cytochrome P450
MADVRSAYADAEHFTVAGNSGFPDLIGEAWDLIPSELDPPYHTEVRRKIDPFFSPSRMMALEGRVRERARMFIDRFRDRGECEFIRDFAMPFPISIFLDLVDMPQDRLEQFYELEQDMINGTSIPQRTAALREIRAILLAEIDRKRKNPGDDLISLSLTLEVDGKRWTDNQIFAFAFTLYLAGLDTVTSNLGLHLYHLATRGDHQRQMREQSAQDNVPAIEELMRAYAAVSTNRICKKEITIAGERIMPGDFVIMATPLAARDPEAYEDPQEIRFDRKPAHITLGFSHHRCLGRHLARRELQIALDEFLGTIPQFQVEPGYAVPFFRSNIIHIETLPLSWR